MIGVEEVTRPARGKYVHAGKLAGKYIYVNQFRIIIALISRDRYIWEKIAIQAAEKDCFFAPT